MNKQSSHDSARAWYGVDVEILRVLQRQGRITNAELAKQVHLSAPAVHARVRKLEKQGTINRYVAILDREALGFDLICFVHVSMNQHGSQHVRSAKVAFQKMPEVLECHHVTGEYDYLLKVVLRDRNDLERFMVERLTPIPGIGRIHTSVVLSEVKSTTELPIN